MHESCFFNIWPRFHFELGWAFNPMYVNFIGKQFHVITFILSLPRLALTVTRMHSQAYTEK